jgi:hypothetical protein
MKRPQKSFSVEIKKSRIPEPRHHLPPRRLFAVPLDKTSASIQKTEPRVVIESVAAPRILPSIIEPAPGNPGPVEPVRRKRSTKSKADREQIELNLDADTEGETSEGSADTPSIPEAEPQTEVAPGAEENATPVHLAQLQGMESLKTNARERRTKPSKLAEPVEAPQPRIQPISVPNADGSIAASDIVTSSRAIPAKRTRHQAAAQLPRSERWKRRLHPAAW